MFNKRSSRNQTKLTLPSQLNKRPVTSPRASQLKSRLQPKSMAIPTPAQPSRTHKPVTQPKTNQPPPASAPKQAPFPRRAAPFHSIQASPSRVIQGVKMYPNLHPGAVEPINPHGVFRLNSFAGQYRLHQVHSHGVNVPNQQYNFVRTREGEMLLHNRYRHPSIAEGKQVLYAGEIFFNNGKLSWWSNGSGHYQPNAEDAEQANLPMECFYSYQQIIKGEHTRKKPKG